MASAANPSYLVDVDRETGELISGWPRIRQSLATILTTRLNTRIMRLWWGSSFLDMQDKPGNDQTFTDGIIAACRAINLYEPEFRVTAVEITNRGPDGTATFTISGIDLIAQAARRTTIPV